MSKSKYTSLIEKIHNSEANWEDRFKFLKLINQLIPDMILEQIPDIQKSCSVLSSQLLDVRSKISKQSSNIICQLASKFKFQFPADLIIKQSLKGLSNSNTVLREYVQQTIQTLIVECQCQRSIPKLIGEFESKNNYVREKIADFILVLIQSIDFEKYQDILEKCLEKGISDKVEVVRKIMRKVYVEYEKQNYDAKHILSTLDPNTIKLIQKQRAQSHTNSIQIKNKQEGQIKINHQYSIQSQKENKIEPKAKISHQKTNKVFESQRQSFNSIKSKPQSAHSRSRYPPQPSSIYANYISPKYNVSKPLTNQLQRQYQILKQQTTEQIGFLLDKVQSSIWNTRLVSLQKLIELLFNKENLTVTQHQISVILKCIISRLQDTHQKVSNLAVEGISQIFPYYSNELLEHSFAIIKRCVRGLTEKNKDQYNQLLSIIKSFDIKNTFVCIVKLVQQSKNKEKMVCLDIMIEILQYGETVESKDVNHIFKLMTNIIMQNKGGAIPALAVISLLRQYHQSRMWGCFIHLSDSQLNKMIELAAEIDPALKHAIVNFTKTNPKTTKQQYQSLVRKQQQRQISLLNITELEAISRNPQFINEYIDLIYEKVQLGQNPSMQRLSVLINSNQFLKEQSLLKLFDILHLSADQTVLVAVNNILDILIIEGGEMFLRCLCEVIKLVKGIHLDMHLEKLKNLVTITPTKAIHQFAEKIIEVTQIHLASEEVEIRRTCVLILAELKTKLKSFPLSKFNPRQQRLIQKYSKQV